MFLIVGLGNPGKKFEKTRHNAGFQAVDFLLESNSRHDLNHDYDHDKKSNAKIIKNKNYILAKPKTFMNNSGQAVQALASYYKIPANKMIIIYDEIDLPFGTVRMRDKGSSAGHNGIKSIIEHLGTDEFNRIRIGIKNDKLEKMDAAKFVLKKFSRSEQKELREKILLEIVEKVEEIIK